MSSEAGIILVGIMVLGILLIGPVWMLVMLFRIRSVQDEQRGAAQDEHRRLLVRLRELENKLASQAESATAAAAAPATTMPPPPRPAMPASQPVPEKPAPPPVIAARPAAEPGVTKPLHIPMPTVTPPPVAAYVFPEPEPGAFEQVAKKILTRIWNWLVVGEEYRQPGTSMESAVATTWLMRSAILLVVVAVGIGLKYSIDKGILGPVGRVALSLLAGATMVIGGLPLLNRRYHIAGQGLVGGGLAVLYFGLFASASLFHLLPMPVAFGMMTLVTLSAGVIAVRFNSLLIAILGILGGYGTPVMLSTGECNFVGLFSYLLLLGGGVLGIARQRQWHLLNVLAMLCTYVLFFSSVHQPGFYTADKFMEVFPFLVAFFVLFSTVMFVYNLRRRESSSLLEVLALLANATVVFYGGYDLIKPSFGQEWVAALTLGLSLFYLGHVYLFLARRLKDRPLLFCFLGLTAFFLTVTVPLLLSGGWITASWSVLALVMFWMGRRLNSRFLQGLSTLVYLLVLARFSVDLHREFGHGAVAGTAAADYFAAMAERLAQFGIPIACFAASWKLSRSQPVPLALTVPPEADVRAGLMTNRFGGTALALVGVLLFVYLQFEFYRMFDLFYQPLCLPALTLVWLGAGAVLLAAARRRPIPGRPVLLILLCAGMFLKLLFWDLQGWHPSLASFGYAGAYDATAALIRLGDFGLVVAFFALGFRLLRGGVVADRRRSGVFLGVLSLILLFIYLTLETSSCLREFQPTLRPGGVSLLWAVFALSMIFAGIVQGVRSLRFAGLALFAVVAAKLYFNDLRHMEQIFRVMVLALIGIAMFFGSVFYQKYQKKT